jgi:alpha-beta hydrolase superfamily lysophospholipase
VLTASVYRTPADLKLPYRTISFADPLGSMPAWYVPATGHLWVIIIHGYRSQRSEGIRVMPVYHALGMPVLDIAYRNDAGAPESRDHLYHLGGTEWKDAQAAAQYALAHGATGLVMMGYSMGGNITEAFLHHSRYASRVRAAVLDSPAIDWSSILDLQARQRHLPNFLTVVGERVIAYRLGASSLDAVNNAVNASELKTPTLLYYGTQDSLVPHTVFASFIAHARSGTLTTVKVPGAGHTESWNVQPHRYDTALRTFLTRIIGFKTAKQHR